ncbi:bifunctional riboflavin kinase/FAD synthetase [Saccharothrix algeriensis]|uniref:Riboflavin biosynthesis protein n=1 Tax=Saccharothrix algeriensis TaxID=173560 RepID=A0A8T8HU39_9PSEU|nr:bifunctional riboflavin kinase/FAD synthetase [Saccharothrix algeriensis]MBM7813488.1 riboflavin kinase/FMN adenylyltransferase [Saccharothrix algeriensis]QTR02002.1 bifunctional riboflavin kinase/FAD synthetase [Saccharothrix algeriensis]
MQRWRGVEHLPGGWGRCVVTIGVFDGVHRGHQALIDRAVASAAEKGVPSVLMTFDPHPSEVVRPGSHPAQLTSLRQRAELVERLGVDVFCVLPFTVEVSRMPADVFVHEVLVDRLHAAAVVVGQNFTFGNRAAGNVDLLRTLGQRFGFGTEGADLVTDDGVTYSSTYIRACIDAGDVKAAAHALGRPHRLEGIVVRGDGRGKELGFPTANLSTARFAAVPADGVYACWFVHGSGRRLRAAVSVGTNPTFSGRERRVEAFVLDVDEDFYGQRVALDFVARLRDMERFDTVEALLEQMHRDVAETRDVLPEAGA